MAEALLLALGGAVVVVEAGELLVVELSAVPAPTLALFSVYLACGLTRDDSLVFVSCPAL